MRRHSPSASELEDVPTEVLQHTVAADVDGWTDFRNYTDRIYPLLAERGLGYSDLRSELARRGAPAVVHHA